MGENVLGEIFSLISRIYESPVTGSESAAHKFELRALVGPRRKNIFAMCLLGLECFAQRINRPFDKNGQ